MNDLPPPVKLFLSNALAKDAPLPSKAFFRQKGSLRTGPQAKKWMDFSATQNFDINRPGFLWEAKIKAFPFLSFSVIDSYSNGVGSGEVKFMGLKIAGEKNRPELNSGALHRYLAEACWCPTSLLPRPGLSWSPINESKAMATLIDNENRVDLEFSFSKSGEVESVFSPNRWGRFESGHQQAPWKGKFYDHFFINGVRIPRRAEVAWQINKTWEPVWKGEILEVNYTSSL